MTYGERKPRKINLCKQVSHRPDAETPLQGLVQHSLRRRARSTEPDAERPVSNDLHPPRQPQGQPEPAAPAEEVRRGQKSFTTRMPPGIRRVLGSRHFSAEVTCYVFRVGCSLASESHLSASIDRRGDGQLVFFCFGLVVLT
jgi:hypothetical protein